jgi:hypothetical protein
VHHAAWRPACLGVRARAFPSRRASPRLRMHRGILRLALAMCRVPVRTGPATLPALPALCTSLLSAVRTSPPSPRVIATKGKNRQAYKSVWSSCPEPSPCRRGAPLEAVAELRPTPLSTIFRAHHPLSTITREPFSVPARSRRRSTRRSSHSSGRRRLVPPSTPTGSPSTPTKHANRTLGSPTPSPSTSPAWNAGGSPEFWPEPPPPWPNDPID